MKNGSLLQLERLAAAHGAVSTHQKIVSTFQRAAR
jgi:hypothetical protein